MVENRSGLIVNVSSPGGLRYLVILSNTSIIEHYLNTLLSPTGLTLGSEITTAEGALGVN